jgi:transposase, IS5 family
MKSDGRLARCPLKGTIGDAIFAVLCSCGHNLRKILADIRALIAAILAAVLIALRPKIDRLNGRIAA